MAPLGGAHERAAHDDSFAARRDVRELLFDMSFVDGVITLEDALALRGATLHDRDVAAGRTGPQRRFLVPTGRGHNCILVRVVDCVRVQFDGQAPRSFWSSYCDRLVAILIDDVELDRVRVEGLGERSREHARRPDRDEEVLERAARCFRREHPRPVQAQSESRLRATRALQVAAARGVLHAYGSRSERRHAAQYDGCKQFHVWRRALAQCSLTDSDSDQTNFVEHA